MTKEKWIDIQGNIQDNFKVVEQGDEHIDDMGGIDIEFIEFMGPLGRMKVEFVVKPVLLDKKTTYSRRGGSDTGVEYVYSKDEKKYTLMAYSWDDGENDWTEIDANNFS